MNSEFLSQGEVVYSGTAFNVRLDSLVLDDGTAVTSETVDTSDSVIILPLLGDSEIVLIQQYRYAVEGWVLEAPAGGIQDGESPLAAAERELLEETGYRAGEMEALGSFWLAPGISNEFMHAFVARDMILEGSQLEKDELIHTAIHDIELITSPSSAGVIQDAKTLGLLWLFRHWYDGS